MTTLREFTHLSSVRLRRLRQTDSIRGLIAQPPFPLQKFIWPIFICSGQKILSPIESLPGQHFASPDQLPKLLEPLVSQGLGGVMLFDATANLGAATQEERHAIAIAIHQLKATFPTLTVCADICVGEHAIRNDNELKDSEGHLRNDPGIKLLARMAVAMAEAGADMVAPSSMLDGKVRAIRQSLEANGFQETLILSYSTKFASSFYEPFRNSMQLPVEARDKRKYQIPCDDLRQGLHESALDEAEGADILMVKPALLYLDVITRLRDQTHLPIAAFNVSGEYTMLHAAAAQGSDNLDDMIRESLCAIRRAGADFVISYWANQYSRLFGSTN